MPDKDLMGALRQSLEAAREQREAEQDAAAVPVPDAEDDELRMALAKTLARANRPSLTNPAAILAEYESWLWAADALLPRIRERVAAAVQAERERASAVRDLHEAVETHHGYTACAECSNDEAGFWVIHPCDTLRALDGTEATDGTR